MDGVAVSSRPTAELTPSEATAIRALLDGAFAHEDEEERFSDDDWDHALGGMHFVARLRGAIVGHAAVLERVLHVGGRPLRTGYVEAVATAPALQGQGIGTVVMREVGPFIGGRFELGALGTGSQGFYERLGWVTWRGASSVRTPAGERPTPEDDGYIMVLLTPITPPLNRDDPISCEWRAGDVW